MTIRYSTGAINNVLNATGLKTLFANGVIRLYTGAQPASADDAVTGTLLGSVTLNGAAFTEGVATNGINFDAPVLRVLSKAAAESWKFTGVAAGTIGWFRYQANAVDNDASSTTLPRIDGSVGITSGDMRLSSVTAAIGTPITIDAFTITAA
jgi:hypothetical protein